jgi:hypothetical protein
MFTEGARGTDLISSVGCLSINGDTGGPAEKTAVLLSALDRLEVKVSISSGTFAELF